MKDSCHVAFFPFTVYGHMIPMTDMTVLFASRGVQATIITTRETTRLFTKSIQKTKNYTYQLTLHIIESRAAKAGLPPGLENSDKPVPSQHLTSFFDVISMLQEPFEQFIQARPNCIVADMFYPWTTKIADKYNIPRIVFNGTGFFPLCVVEAMRVYDLARDVSSDSEPFIVPHLPHKIIEAEVTSYGVVINSFYELEPQYARHYREAVKKKAWHIGPVSLCSKNKEDTLERGEKSGTNGQECLRWLDSKARDSVVYVGFGTMVTVTSSQLYEIAMGLEAYDNDFIWVIKNEEESSFPEGFEARLKEKGKGLIIKGWAPYIQAKLDAELIEEQKLARKQEEEANIALIESWENTQAMMEADRLLAERLQSKEREELTNEGKGKLFMELMEKRRKHFAALRAQEKRNRPPTKVQKRTQMSTYLKHMGGYTCKQLKGKSFDEIQKLFDKEMKRVNTFVAMGSEVQ
ncbi:hypothetical protein Tco_0018127 [Tanacetum coccineum]